MKIRQPLRPADLSSATTRVFEIAAAKVVALDRAWEPARGAPVFTVEGRYTTRGWTEWTQGFQYGCALLAFDGTLDPSLHELGRRRTLDHMLVHVTHMGVHDHGFNNISTYGNLRRLMLEGRVADDPWERRCYETALRCSGAVQAMRWAPTAEGKPAAGGGYIYSFNGPHSLFVDTMRTLRILGLAHQLGQVLMGENDERISLLSRLIGHGLTTARTIVCDGRSGHHYDVRGRTAHEAVFNRNDGRFRCRSTQQGYSPFSTWTRGLAWAMLGYAEQLEFLAALTATEVRAACGLGRAEVLERFEAAARATCDHYIDGCSAADGVVYWDDGAPGLARMGDWRSRPADPTGAQEPVDASASAIAAQGLIRLGHHLGRRAGGRRYRQAGLTVAATLFDDPYLCAARRHQGLLRHSIYHRPNAWDHVPRGRKVPCGESSMWGDYHLLELAALVRRLAGGGPYPVFFDLPARARPGPAAGGRCR